MENIFIGRQAIYDRSMRLYAYELLYRESFLNQANMDDGDQATSRVILNAFMDIGLERIAGDQRVFLNLTRNLLVDQQPIPFLKERVVLEILETVPIDKALLRSAANLVRQGYTLALDDFAFEPRWDPLLPLAGVIKIEVPSLDWDRLDERIERLKQKGVLLLAEKVETKAEYARLKALDFDLFQGYYFSRPQIITGKRLHGNQLLTIKLLANLNQPAVTPVKLESLISQDPGLVFKILRYLNSAALSLPRKIESIRQAIVYIGLNRLRAWASLIALSRVEDKPEELFTTALVRAHMCSLLTSRLDREMGDQAFTAGLLSILDSLMDLSLNDIIVQMPLSDPIREALTAGQGLLGEALGCARAFEDCRWSQARFQNTSTGDLQEIYNRSSELAFQERQMLLD